MRCEIRRELDNQRHLNAFFIEFAVHAFDNIPALRMRLAMV